MDSVVGKIIGSFSIDDGNDNENVTWKLTPAKLCLFVIVPILFAFYNFGKVRYIWCVRREIKYRELKLYICIPKLSSKR